MGFLVTTMIWAAFVAAALWPPFRRGRLGSFVSVLAMAANEVPLVLLAIFAATVASMVVDPPDGEPPSSSAYLPAALIVLGLIWLQVRARSARPTLEAALRAGLGADWQAAIELAAARHLRTSTPWLAGILLPFQRRARGVVRLRNLRYGPEPRAHRLDMYRGRDRSRGRNPGHTRSGGRPILIHLHGGGFTQGGRSREGIMLLNQLASRGWLCISADYRLRAGGVFPNPLVDTKRVIAWAREHAAEHGADASQVFLVGSSAGGHLAVSAALTANEPRFQPGFENADTRVAAAVVLYGYLGPRTPDPDSSPATLARTDAPPLLIIHGADDTMVPPAGPQAVATGLRSASYNPVIYAELPHTQHNVDFFASVRARVVADAVEGFLGWVRSRHHG